MTDQDKAKVEQVERLLHRMRGDEAAASKFRLVVVKVSPMRYQLVRITGAVPVGFGAFWDGEVVFGPDTRQGCMSEAARLIRQKLSELAAASAAAAGGEGGKGRDELHREAGGAGVV